MFSKDRATPQDIKEPVIQKSITKSWTVTTSPGTRQFAGFAAAGAMATCVQYCALVAMVEFARFDPTVAAVFAYICGAITSYILNFHFVFKGSATNFRSGLAKSLLVNLIGLGFNTAIFVTLRKFGAYYLLAQAVATGVVLVWNYAGARLFVFRSPANQTGG